jgi:plastocyanin
MRQFIFVLIVVLTAKPALAANPATQPTTQPVSIRGHVEIEAGLQKQDMTRAVIYLAEALSLAGPPPQDHYVVGQLNKAFVPNFIVIPQGADVEFPNWDKFSHNVFSRSAAAPAFDLDRYPCGCSKRRTFDKIGIVQLFCNIHPYMHAVIVVTPNRFAVRANANGDFEMTGVPAGKYELVAWHERCDEQKQPATVGDAVPTLAFHLHENHDAVIAAAPADKRAGYGVERGLGVKREVLRLPVVSDVHPAIDPPPTTQP